MISNSIGVRVTHEPVDFLAVLNTFDHDMLLNYL